MAQRQLSDFLTQKIANSAAAGSAIGFGVTLAEIDHIISIAAGVAAIISASAAAWYYITKTRREGNGEDNERESS